MPFRKSAVSLNASACELSRSPPSAPPWATCSGWESNPHGDYSPKDFKSSASAVPPPERMTGQDYAMVGGKSCGFAGEPPKRVVLGPSWGALSSNLNLQRRPQQ